MKETTGEEYQSSQFAKALCVSEAKAGKTCFLLGSALGVLPWQQYGGIVDKPENLHVIALDSNAIGGAKEFLLQTCKAPPEAMKFTVYNMQDDIRRASNSRSDWDTSLYNAFINVARTAADRIRKSKGVGVILVSSVTGIAPALERAIGGPPGEKKQTMDMSKWSEYNRQLAEIRNLLQQDDYHTLWEGHILRVEREGQGGTTVKETLQLRGQAGQNFAYNVEQIFRIKRLFGESHPGTECDAVYLDTRPEMDFVVNGRGFTEKLKQKEPDMTVAFAKLGLEVGRWGAKAPKKKKS
jgi:hypothetical protein